MAGIRRNVLFIAEETSRGEFLINRNMQMIPEFYFSPVM